MKTLHTVLNKVLTIGLDKEDLYIQQKVTVISNKISLLLMPFMFLGMLISYQREVYFSTVGFGLTVILLISIFLLNNFRKFAIARLNLSITLSLLLLIPNMLGGIWKEENYLVFSYIFIAFSIIPNLLFQDKRDKGLLIIALVINLLIIIYFDVLMVWSETLKFDIRFIEENYTYYKLPQIILWGVMVATIQFLNSEGNSYREKLERSTNSLRESNQQIRRQNEKIHIQHVELGEQKLCLEVQHTKLNTSNNELKNTKLELLNTIDRLKHAKNETMQQKAEMKCVYKALHELYLVAQYDLEGKLVSINTKVIELLGILNNEHFENIKPIINKSYKNQSDPQTRKSFTKVWERVLAGATQIIELEFKVGNDAKTLLTIFAPVFDEHNTPIRILAIGHDVSELMEKNNEIDQINNELKEKISQLNQQKELLNFQQSQIFEYSEELHKQKEEMQTINNLIEMKVEKRTGYPKKKTGS